MSWTFYLNKHPVFHLSKQRDSQRSGWDNLRQQQEEHSEWEQDTDGQAHLLTGVWGQVEHQDREEADTDTGDDQIDSVEQGLASQFQCEDNVWIWLL